MYLLIDTCVYLCMMMFYISLNTRTHLFLVVARSFIHLNNLICLPSNLRLSVLQIVIWKVKYWKIFHLSTNLSNCHQTQNASSLATERILVLDYCLFVHLLHSNGNGCYLLFPTEISVLVFYLFSLHIDLNYCQLDIWRFLVLLNLKMNNKQQTAAAAATTTDNKIIATNTKCNLKI